MTHTRRGWSLKTKLTTTYTLIVILVAGILAFTLYQEIHQAQRQAIREHLHDVVSFAATQIDGDFHTLIVSPEDAESSYYTIIFTAFRKMQTISAAITHIYTVRQRNDGSIVMVVDSNTTPGTPTTIGQKIDTLTPLLKAGLDTIRQPVVEEHLSINASGDTLLYGYAPIVDQSGRQDGLVAIVFDASKITDSQKQARNAALIAFFVTLPLVLLIGFLLVQHLMRPIKELSRGAERIARGQIDQRVPVHSDDELGLLAETFNTMADSLQARIAAEHQALENLRYSHRQLEEHSHSLEQAMNEQQRLSDTVREMSLPIIPIAERIIVIPLVGTIDTYRAVELSRKLLQGVEFYRARVVLIDLTGVPLVDSQVAQTLLEGMMAVRLLGAKTLVVGIRPELAEAFIHTGTDVRTIETASTLQSGLLRALHLMGKRVMTTPLK